MGLQVLYVNYLQAFAAVGRVRDWRGGRGDDTYWFWEWEGKKLFSPDDIILGNFFDGGFFDAIRLRPVFSPYLQ